MAEKRMFAKTIIDSDLFLDMPLSTQALYFHLSMRADDDGFVNNPKKIMRMIGASEDDIKILISKQFVLSFESGVIVIRHWKLHNCIQKDRYKPTLCVDEKLLIGENTSKEYLYTGCIQDGNRTETECIQSVYTDKIRLDKIRIDKNRLDKGSEEGETATDVAEKKTPYHEVIDLFNSICISYPKVKSLSDARKKAIKARFNNGYRLEDFEICFNNAENSGFLKGKNNKNWSANFDWLIKDANMAKVLDGNYNTVASETHHEEKPQSEYDRFMSDLQEIYNESE